MDIVDPLKIKLKELMRLGEANPLNKGRLRYGTDEDVKELINYCKSAAAGDGDYFLVDLTPFERIGRGTEILDALGGLTHPLPVLMVMGDSLLAQMRAERVRLPVIVAQFDDKGHFQALHGEDTQIRVDRKQIELDLAVDEKNGAPAMQVIRREFANRLLTKLLYSEGCVVRPRKGDKSSVFKYGQYFRRMPNGMLVSCYFNLKELGKDITSLVAVAYEALLVLSGYFRRDKDPLADFDTIAVPNNTALFLAATLQEMLEMKQLVAIDRMGPIPTRHLHTQALVRQLERRKVVLVEEVVATGNEVDRSLLILGSIQAEVKQILAFYNLEVGSPMLVKRDHLTSLCRPKEELNYVYRSA